MRRFEASDEEENFRAEVADLNTKQIEQEERARRVRKSLRNNSRVALGDLRGDWTLYSSQALATLVELPESEIDQLGDQWTAGEFTIDSMEDYGPRMATHAEITLMLAEEYQDISICLTIPRFASKNPMAVTAVKNETAETFGCNITFLAPDLMELRIPGKAVSSDIDADELYYVAVLNEVAEEDSDTEDYYGQGGYGQPFEGYHLSDSELAFVAAAYPEYM